MREWLAEQTAAFRDTVEPVVVNPSAPYAAGIPAALPRARIAVDKWHLVALANTVITDVRERVSLVISSAAAAPSATRSG